jgi:hypothetical protein
LKKLVCLWALVPACALVHERGTDVDAGPRDTGPVAVDVGVVTSCTDFWGALPSCPASTMDAIGQSCFEEGATCGSHCCEPGPPIGCVDGHWSPVDHMDDCRGVRCGAPSPCFDGQCAYGRVCVVASGEVLAAPHCVVPPAPMTSCGDAPPGSLSENPMACISCTCAAGPSGSPIVTLECPCC